MLPTRDWLDAAQSLPEGGRTRINHACGGGRTLLVSHNRDTWSAYCFRCGEPGVENKPTESWHERLARITQAQSVDEHLERTTYPPGPPNFDVDTWPASAQVWLYKAGINVHGIAELGAYWHASSGRVILPVFDGEDIIYWQGRDPEWTRRSKRAKYINPRADKQYLVAKFGRGNPLVLTEDVLSAYRVGQLTEAWSLMGTTLTDHVAASISLDRPVAVWLDPDRAGIAAARNIIKQLTSFGVQARRLKTRADPKCLSDREITQWLKVCT